MSELGSRYTPRTAKETVLFVGVPVVESANKKENVEVPVLFHLLTHAKDGLLGDAITKKSVGAAVNTTSYAPAPVLVMDVMPNELVATPPEPEVAIAP